MNKLEKDCTYPPNYLQSIYDSKEQEVDKLCPVKKNNLKFDLKELYKFIYKEPIIIYNGQDFQLTLSMSENNENNDIGSDGTIYGGDIFLSIVKDN
ncbi:hypothetical protein B5803_02100, partial [Gilliamella apicola]